MATIAFLFSLILLLPGIGSGYWGRDEAEYAGVAHAMNASGDFLVPRLFGKLYPDKPPLSEWLTALSFRLLGERETAGRLPHVLLAAGSAALLVLLRTQLLGARRGAVVVAVLFSTSLLFVVYGRLLLTDLDLLFFTLLSLIGLVPLLEGRVAWWPSALAGVGLGLSLLAKGPVALLVPLLFCGGYLAGGRDRSFRSIGRLLPAFAIGLAIAVPWFLLAARATGGASLRAFLWRENLGRFLSAREGHHGSILYFPLVAWFGFFPWTGFFLNLFRRRSLERSPARWALLSWAGGLLLFFTLSATKLPHYLLPAMPALALLAAPEAWPEREAWRRRIDWTTAITGSLLFAAAVIAVCRVAEPAAIALVFPFALAAFSSLLLPLLPRGLTLRWSGIGAALFSSAAIAFCAPPVVDRLRSTPRLGVAARELRRAGEPLGGLRIREAGLTYYAGGEPTEAWNDPPQVVLAVSASPTRSVLVWLDSSDAVRLARDLRLSVQTLAWGPSLADPRVRDRLELCRASVAPALRKDSDVSNHGRGAARDISHSTLQ